MSCKWTEGEPAEQVWRMPDAIAVESDVALQREFNQNAAILSARDFQNAYAKDVGLRFANLRADHNLLIDRCARITTMARILAIVCIALAGTVGALVQKAFP